MYFSDANTFALGVSFTSFDGFTVPRAEDAVAVGGETTLLANP